MAKKIYTLKQKIKYYSARAVDSSLTAGQRDYANSFLDSVSLKDLDTNNYSITEIQSKIATSKKRISTLMLDNYPTDIVNCVRGNFAGELAYWEELLRKKGGG